MKTKKKCTFRRDGVVSQRCYEDKTDIFLSTRFNSPEIFLGNDASIQGYLLLKHFGDGLESTYGLCNLQVVIHVSEGQYVLFSGERRKRKVTSIEELEKYTRTINHITPGYSTVARGNFQSP